MRPGLAKHESERKERNLEVGNVRHAVECAISTNDHNLVVAVFLYDERTNCLVPFACKGMPHDRWVSEARGKHEHGFVRGVFDRGRMTCSANIHAEPNAVDRWLLMKRRLAACCGIPLFSQGVKFGVMCVMKRESGFFNISERAVFLRCARRVAGLVADARIKVNGRFGKGPWLTGEP